MNLYPEEVEEVLVSYPGVKEALVYGAPDPLYQEVPKAKIVVNGQVSTKELQKYAMEKLSAFKVPVSIEICQALEKTDTGKLKRKGVVLQ